MVFFVNDDYRGFFYWNEKNKDSQKREGILTKPGGPQSETAACRRKLKRECQKDGLLETKKNRPKGSTGKKNAAKLCGRGKLDFRPSKWNIFWECRQPENSRCTREEFRKTYRRKGKKSSKVHLSSGQNHCLQEGIDRRGGRSDVGELMVDGRRKVRLAIPKKLENRGGGRARLP